MRYPQALRLLSLAMKSLIHIVWRSVHYFPHRLIFILVVVILVPWLLTRGDMQSRVIASCIAKTALVLLHIKLVDDTSSKKSRLS